MSSNGFGPSTVRLGTATAVTRRVLLRHAAAAGIGAAALGTLPADSAIAGGQATGGEGPRALAGPADPFEELREKGPTALVQAMRDRDFGDRNIAAAIVALARAGVATYEAPDAGGPMLPVEGTPSPVRFLLWQVRTMALEVSARSGQLGADLDGLAPAADGGPSHSQALVAYAGSSSTPGGEIAGKLIDAPDFNQAGETLFPAIVQAFFAGELARDAASANPGALTGEPLTSGCASMKEFVQAVLLSVMMALVDAPEGSFEKISQASLEYYRDHAPAMIEGLGEEAKVAYLAVKIQRAAAVLAIAAEIVSLAKPWGLRIEPSPKATRFGVGNEEVDGQIVARMDFGGLTEWPAELTSCAADAGLTLPPFSAAGEPISWTTYEAPVQLLGSSREATTLDDDGQAHFRYVTNQESPEQAQGQEKTGRLIVKATVERTAMVELGEQLLDAIRWQLPYFPHVQAAFDEWKLPILVEQFLPLTRVTGAGVVAVVYHEEDETAAAAQPALGVDQRLVGTWEVGDLTGYYDAVETGLEGDGFSFDFVHQGGGEFFTFLADGTFEVSATELMLGALGQTPLGEVDAAVVFNGTATGVWAADGTVMTLTYTGGDLGAVFTITTAGVTASDDYADPVGSLPQGSIAYTLSGNRLDLVTSRTAVPWVLTRLG